MTTLTSDSICEKRKGKTIWGNLNPRTTRGNSVKVAQFHRKTADLATLFSYNPKQTHLNKLIFRITVKLQVGLELNSCRIVDLEPEVCPVFKKVEIIHVAIVYKIVAIYSIIMP